MKNLYIFVSPNKKLPPEYEDLIKIQIDNSLEMGWKKEDIIFAANFDYEYKGVRSVIVGDYEVFDQNRSTKIPAINELFRKNLIMENEIYWFHDFDAFQLVPFEVELNKDAGFTTHGYSGLWNAGSFFFKKSSREIFLKIEEYMNLRNSNEQNALTYMWNENVDGINEKCQIMNQTYNIGIYHIDKIVGMSEKPIKVAHFHPHKKRHLDLFRDRNMLPESLLAIFSKYGIR